MKAVRMFRMNCSSRVTLNPPRRAWVASVPLQRITNGAAGVSAVKFAKCEEPRRPQFLRTYLCWAYVAEHVLRNTRAVSRRVAWIEVVRRLLLPLRRHLGRRELGRAPRPAETRLREIVLARPHRGSFALGLVRHGRPHGCHRKKPIV